MSKIKVVSKGYTITVNSWENDADYRQTNSKTVQTIDEVKVWAEMMELCESKSNQPKGVIKLGNTYDGFDKRQEEVAKDFMKDYHKILVPGDDIEEHEDDLADWFCDLAGSLLGYGDNYACRVCESYTVTYSPEDIYVEQIIL